MKGMNTFLELKLFEFRISNDMDLLLELEILFSQLRELQITLPYIVQVGVILSKFSPSRHDYKKKIMYSTVILLDSLLLICRLNQPIVLKSSLF